MEAHATNWTPGILVLAAALAAAILFLLNGNKKVSEEKKPAGKKGTPEDLDERYRALLSQLKDHAAQKHLMPEGDWAAEQGRLEQAAAAVLREKAGASHEALKAQARAEKLKVDQQAATGFMAHNPTLRGALMGGGLVAFFVMVAFALTSQSTEREGTQGMTSGNPAMQGGRGPMQQNNGEQEVARLKALAEKSPEDIEVLSDVAGQLIKMQAFNEAFPIVTRASGLDPYHVQTRIWRAILDAVDGQGEAGVAQLEHLGDTYDGAWRARLYAGLIAVELEQPQRALKQLELFMAEAPPSEQPPFVAMYVQQLRSQLAGAPPMGKP